MFCNVSEPSEIPISLQFRVYLFEELANYTKGRRLTFSFLPHSYQVDEDLTIH